jgi:hypothetical protein
MKGNASNTYVRGVVRLLQSAFTGSGKMQAPQGTTSFCTAAEASDIDAVVIGAGAYIDYNTLLVVGAIVILTCSLPTGVVGLACARALALAGHEVIILEQHSAFGTETSSRHSEVIHAGIYYPQGSLKAQLCVQGKHMLYDYCNSKDIPHKKITKLIVATNER